MPETYVKMDHPAVQAMREAWAKVRGRFYIYALVDPEDRTIRYVGKTYSLGMRFYQHFAATHRNEGLRRWVSGLREKMSGPDVEVLQMAGEESWEAAERAWIRLLRQMGSLLNIQDGGMTRGKAKKLQAKRRARYPEKEIARLEAAQALDRERSEGVPRRRVIR